ncbi:pilus assembly protein [Hyalangium gracile]|uniref:hypothetical protein n=1 Tax=Hyalangium gracile TaxID=394092 RepID=UPI001CCACA5C|nr:hypothetical protein [Hyalangium gracile]
MNSITRRLGLGLLLLGAAVPASAQQVAPPNIHFLMDTSGSMRELPQVKKGLHSAFFNETTNGCVNPSLDLTQALGNWNPATVYPVPDSGTGLGSDTGFPNLFKDDKFYAYMYWGDSSEPTWQWDSKEQSCQSQVANWNTTGATEYNRCLTCLSTKGYYKVPGAYGSDSPPMNSLDFIFWGRFLNFNPPKYVSAKAALKKSIKYLQNTRAGLTIFSTNSYGSELLMPHAPACSVILGNPTAFDNAVRGALINEVNAMSFSTSTPLAKSLLNVGYYFSSDNSVYQSTFGFGSSYSYPYEFKNTSLTSDHRSVCWGCQTNAVIIVTDGEPTSDSLSSTLASRIRTVNGGPTYCPSSAPCGAGTAATRDIGTNIALVTDDNPNYYLDDVAKMLHQRDLQVSTPEQVGDFNTAGEQSLLIYTVGFTINSNLLSNTAAVGGGQYYTADTAVALQQALENIFADVQWRATSCTYTPPPAP